MKRKLFALTGKFRGEGINHDKQKFCEFRGGGLSAVVINAITDLARERGATAIEAYPTDPWDEARVFRGNLTTYQRLGFKCIASEPDGSTAIVVMSKSLLAARHFVAEEGADQVAPLLTRFLTC